jgi:stringent starvation protein B
MHEWMVDNGFTPHLVVDARRDGVRVPEAHVQDGKIVLNVSPAATLSLSLGNDFVMFGARFGGVTQQLVIPIGAVLGIYARETGQGMIFSDDDATPPTPTPAVPAPSSPKPSKTKLKIVK